MADIKVREVRQGHIKTLDRAASSMHHIKETTVRTKISDISGRQDNESTNSYAQDAVEHYAGDSSAYAARAGVELIQRSRGENSGYSGKSDESFHRLGMKSPETAGVEGKTDENIQRVFREEGVKAIRNRQKQARLADAEALGNAEEYRRNSRIRGAAVRRGDEQIHRFGRQIAVNRIKSPKTDELIQRQRRQHAINRILNRQSARAQNYLMLFRRKGRSGKKASAAASSFVRYIWERTRAYILTLGAGGTAAVIILTLFVFFGIGTITFSNNSPETSVTAEQEEIVYFIPDLAGSPTRYAIVKAAAREIGNVGGRKFWSWYGFNGYVSWCACFTSYIAAECGCIQSGICPKASWVDDWVQFYKKQHRWAGRNYIPHSGDFIIFDWDRNGVPNHIGIVESCDGKTIHTIEGNSGDRCKRNTYTRGSSFIMGYGCPNYSGR